MTKFKIGDKFIPRKPKNDKRWKRGMDKYEGHTFTVYDIIDCTDGLAIIAMEGNAMFLADWCEKVSGNSEIPNDHIPDVGKLIDWEQRRYELAKELMAAQVSGFASAQAAWSFDGAIRGSILWADEMIKQLKEE